MSTLLPDRGFQSIFSIIDSLMTKQSTKKQHFTSVLEASNNKLWGAHFTVPVSVAKRFTAATSRRVVCTLNGAETFQCALIPHGNGSFVITVNKKLRDKQDLKFGMTVDVSLRKDESEYGLPMPKEFAELLRQDKRGNRLFHALTAGRQRTLLYIIGQRKTTDARIERGIVVVEHLKATNGKIDYKKLNESLKKANRIGMGRTKSSV